jgi:hypothetical protein
MVRLRVLTTPFNHDIICGWPLKCSIVHAATRTKLPCGFLYTQKLSPYSIKLRSTSKAYLVRLDCKYQSLESAWVSITPQIRLQNNTENKSQNRIEEENHLFENDGKEKKFNDKTLKIHFTEMRETFFFF